MMGAGWSGHVQGLDNGCQVDARWCRYMGPSRGNQRVIRRSGVCPGSDTQHTDVCPGIDKLNFLTLTYFTYPSTV